MGKILEPGFSSAPPSMRGAILVSKERTWSEFGISEAALVPPETKTVQGTVGQHYPNGLWMCSVWGRRSDGLRSQITMNVDGRWFTRPDQFFRHFRKAFEQLATFRDCSCTGPAAGGLPGQLCRMHGGDPTNGARMETGKGPVQTDVEKPRDA